MRYRFLFCLVAVLSFLGCGGGFQSAQLQRDTIPPVGTPDPDPNPLGDRPVNPELMLQKSCDAAYSWEGATGSSSSLQILQKPDSAFDYVSGYRGVFKELVGKELTSPLNELTQPVVLISHLTLYSSDSSADVLPAGEVRLKFGVKLSDLLSSFSDIWFGTILSEEAVFKIDLEKWRGHVCNESLAMEFWQISPGTARLIILSEKSDADRGLLVRLWLKTQTTDWRYIGYTWIDRRALMGPASVPIGEKNRGPASQAERNGFTWIAWLVLAAGVLAAVTVRYVQANRRKDRQ